MTEVFSNNAVSTLSSPISSTIISLTVANATSFPSTGNFRVKVDSEIMLVTAVSGNNFTVTRGIESTSATPHVSGATIAHVLTATALSQFKNEMVITGPAASLPSASITNAVLYIANDSPYIYYNNGSSWSTFGPLMNITTGPQYVYPVTAGWSWVNQGNATLVTSNNGYHLLDSGAGQSSNNLMLRVVSAPATPYHVIGAFQMQNNADNNTRCGLLFRDGSGGGIVATSFRTNGGAFFIDYTKWDNPTTFDSHYFSGINTNVTLPLWVRIGDNGSNRTFDISSDGTRWINLDSRSRTDFITPTQVGFYVCTTASTSQVIMQLLSWQVTS